MVAAAMKHMALNFAKLDKFEGVNFRRWQKKMHFLISSLSVVYVLTTPISKDGENAIVKQLRKKAKWDNDEYVCRGLIFNDFKHTLKHQKEELTLVKLGSHLRIEGSRKVQDNDKPNGNNVAGPSAVNMIKHNNSFRCNDNKGKRRLLKKDCEAFMSTSKLNILWHARLGHVHFRRMQDMSKDGLIPAFNMDTEKCKTFMRTKITKKPFQNVKPEIEVLELIHSDLCDLYATPSLGNKKYFVKFINDALRFCYVYLLHTKDEVLENSKVFKSKVKLQQGSLIKRFRIDRGVVPEKVTEEVVVQQPKLELKKSKRNRTLKNFGLEFQLHLIEGTRDEVYDQHSYCFNVEDDPKTFDEAMKSQDVALLKEAINDEMDSITGVIICLYVDDMLIFDTDHVQVELTNELLSSRFSLKDMREANVIMVSTPVDTSEKLMLNSGQVVSQLDYSRVIGCLISTIESEFMALVGMEDEWLRNLILEISLWLKPIAPISIRCDSVATLGKAYNQMYNGKSKHLGVKHSMIRELIMNMVVSIEFVRSQ
uniref:Zinc finger, CCHC-type n=1 Tax=Tanacetum cinerariifolium TaxID=118510 RepID=A0A6L2K6Q9_TANCI|nr:zinc finger, CCHC-type [Tanacetum cinerariifolium]